MIVNLLPLINNIENVIEIDNSLTFPQTDLDNVGIRRLEEAKVKGFIIKIYEEYELNLEITGNMILPCSISLVDVLYPIKINIHENIDENEEYFKIIDNSLDIMPIVWQNIVVEIPMKVISPDVDHTLLKGDGWKLSNEEDKENELDPRLDKLRDLLDNRKEN